MTHSFDGYNHLVRLQKGEKLSDAIAQFVAEVDIDGAWVDGLGGALEVTLGFYNLDTKQYQWQAFKGLREITGLQGNLALGPDGKIMSHLHGTFAGPDYQVVGGHIQDLIAGATVELFIHRSYHPMRRKSDPATGLPLLDLGD